MKRVQSVLFLLLVLCRPTLAASPRADRALDASVAGLASLVTDGYATLDRARRLPIRAGHLTAVVFNLRGPGGGNGSWQFLAFFETNAGLPGAMASSRYRLLGFTKIGSVGDRLFDPATAKMRHRQLTIDGAAFARGDASCCPSRAIHSRFLLQQDGAVVEQAAR